MTVLLLATSTCVAPPSDALVGLWESRSTSKGGIGHALEFRRDGTAVASTTVIVDLFYRISKDRLSVGEAADPATQSAFRFELDGDTLVVTEPDGSHVRKERLGPRVATSSSIVGAWRYRHYTDATAYERYTEDGRVLFRLPMTADVGCYRLSGGTLSMSAPKSVTVPFELRNDELILAREGDRPLVYGRVTGGAWYPRDPAEIKSRAKPGAAPH